MDDLISRQAAIEYYKRIIDATDTDGRYNLGFVDGLEFCINHLSTMPSAQPELTEKVEEILTYLDTELHPIVSPEHWNIYSELYDMISALPTAQPERKKGKWIKRGRMVQCSECGRFTTVKENYCPNCGLDNREEKTDDGSNVISKNT